MSIQVSDVIEAIQNYGETEIVALLGAINPML